MSGWSGTVVLAALWWVMPPGAPSQAGEAAARVAAVQGCPAGLVEQLDHVAGTPVYRSLHREIAALRLGHEGSEKLQTALAPAAGAAAPAKRQIVQLMTGMDNAREAYLCGAWVAGMDGGATPVDAVMRESIGPVFERMGEEVSRLENSLVTETAGRPAESTGRILEERRKTDAELLDAVAKSEAGAVDGDLLRVTCVERGRLIGEIAVWSKTGRDEFTVAAGMMQEFLRIHQRCAAA